MIAVLDIWNRLNDYSQKYQSGVDTVAYFNSKLAEVQVELFNEFSPLYDESDKINTLLDCWVVEQTGSSNSSGVVTVGTSPQVVNRPLAMGLTNNSGDILFQIPKISESQLVASARIPQRAPNVANKNVYYNFKSPDTLQLYPKVVIPYDLFYLIYPTAANIAFTYSTVSDEDIMTYDSADSVDLAWPQAAFNLILYLMLEKYGVSVRDEILQEYAKFGIMQTETAGQVATGEGSK